MPERRMICWKTFTIVTVLTLMLVCVSSKSDNDSVISGRRNVLKSLSKRTRSFADTLGHKWATVYKRHRTRFSRAALPSNDVSRDGVIIDVHAPRNVLKGEDLTKRHVAYNRYDSYVVHALTAAADDIKSTNIVIICATAAICLHFFWCVFISCWESYRWKKRVLYHLTSDSGRGFYPYIVFLKTDTTVNKGNRCRDSFMHFVIEGMEGSSETFSFNCDSAVDVNEYSGTMFLLQTEGCLGNLVAFHIQITGLEHCCIKCKVSYVEVIDPVTNEKWYFPLRETVQSGCGPVRASRNTRQEKEYWLWKDSFNRAWHEYNVWSALGYQRRYGSGVRRALHLTLPLLLSLYIMLVNTFTISMSTTITWRLLAAFVVNAAVAALVAFAQWVMRNTRVSKKSLSSRVPLLQYLRADVSGSGMFNQRRLQYQQQQQQQQQQKRYSVERSMLNWSTPEMHSFGQSQGSYGTISGFPSYLNPPVGVFSHHRGSYQVQDLPFPFMGGDDRDERESDDRSIAPDEGDITAETNQCMLPDGTIVNICGHSCTSTTCPLHPCAGAPCVNVCAHGSALPSTATCCYTTNDNIPCQQNTINSRVACATNVCAQQNTTVPCQNCPPPLLSYNSGVGLSKVIDNCTSERCRKHEGCTNQCIYPTSVTFNHCPDGRKEGQSLYQVSKPYSFPAPQTAQIAAKLEHDETLPSNDHTGRYTSGICGKNKGIFNQDTWRKAQMMHSQNQRTHSNVNLNHIASCCEQDLDIGTQLQHALISSTAVSKQGISRENSCRHDNERHMRKLKQIKRSLDSYCKHHSKKKSKCKLCHHPDRSKNAKMARRKCKQRHRTSDSPPSHRSVGESEQHNHLGHFTKNDEACERFASSLTERIFNTVSDNVLNRNVNASNTYVSGASPPLADAKSSDTDGGGTNDAVIFKLDKENRIEKLPSDENLADMRKDIVEMLKDLSGASGIRSSVQEILNMARSHRFRCEDSIPSANQTTCIHQDANTCETTKDSSSAVRSTDDCLESDQGSDYDTTSLDDTNNIESDYGHGLYYHNYLENQTAGDLLRRKLIGSSVSSHSCSVGLSSSEASCGNRRVCKVVQASLASLLRPDALCIIQQTARAYGELELANFAAEIAYTLYDVVYNKMKRLLLDVANNREVCEEHNPEVLLTADEQSQKLVIPVVVRHVTYLLEMEPDAFHRMQLVIAMIATGSEEAIDMIVTNAYMQTQADAYRQDLRARPDATARRTGALGSIFLLPALARNLTNNNNNTTTLANAEAESYLRLLFANVLLLRQKTRDNQSLVDDVTNHALNLYTGHRLCLWLLRESQSQLDRAFAEVRMRTRRCPPSLLTHFSESVLQTVSSLPPSQFAEHYHRTLASVSGDMRAYAMRNACRKVARHLTQLLTSRNIGVVLERWYRIAKMMENADDTFAEDKAVEGVLQTDLVFGLFDFPASVQKGHRHRKDDDDDDEFAKKQLLLTMTAEFEELKQIIKNGIAKSKYENFKKKMSQIFEEHAATTKKMNHFTFNKAAQCKKTKINDGNTKNKSRKDKAAHITSVHMPLQVTKTPTDKDDQNVGQRDLHPEKHQETTGDDVCGKFMIDYLSNRKTNKPDVASVYDNARDDGTSRKIEDMPKCKSLLLERNSLATKNSAHLRMNGDTSPQNCSECAIPEKRVNTAATNTAHVNVSMYTTTKTHASSLSSQIEGATKRREVELTTREQSNSIRNRYDQFVAQYPTLESLSLHMRNEAVDNKLPLRKANEQLNLPRPPEAVGVSRAHKYQYNPLQIGSDDVLRHLAPTCRFFQDAARYRFPISSKSENGIVATCMAHDSVSLPKLPSSLADNAATFCGPDDLIQVTVSLNKCKIAKKTQEAAERNKTNDDSGHLSLQLGRMRIEQLQKPGCVDTTTVQSTKCNAVIPSKIPRLEAKRAMRSKITENTNSVITSRPSCIQNKRTTKTPVSGHNVNETLMPECEISPAQVASSSKLDVLNSEAVALRLIDAPIVKCTEVSDKQQTKCVQSENTEGVVTQKSSSIENYGGNFCKPDTAMDNNVKDVRVIPCCTTQENVPDKPLDNKSCVDMPKTRDLSSNSMYFAKQELTSPIPLQNKIVTTDFTNVLGHTINKSSSVGSLHVPYKTADVSRHIHGEIGEALTKCYPKTRIRTFNKDSYDGLKIGVFNTNSDCTDPMTFTQSRYGLQGQTENDNEIVYGDTFDDIFEYNLDCIQDPKDDNVASSKQKATHDHCLSAPVRSASENIRDGLVMEMVDKINNIAKHFEDSCTGQSGRICGSDRCRVRKISKRYEELAKSTTTHLQAKRNVSVSDTCEKVEHASSRSIVEYFENMSKHQRSLETNARTRHVSLPSGVKSSIEYADENVQQRIKRNTISSIPVKTLESCRKRGYISDSASAKCFDSVHGRNTCNGRDLWNSNVCSEHMRSHIPVAMSPPKNCSDAAADSEQSRKRRHSASDKLVADRKSAPVRTQTTEPCTTKSRVHSDKVLNAMHGALFQTNAASTKSCSASLGKYGSQMDVPQSLTVYSYKNKETQRTEQETKMKSVKSSGVENKSTRGSSLHASQIARTKPAFDTTQLAESIRRLKKSIGLDSIDNTHLNKSANNSCGRETDDICGDDTVENESNNLEKSESGTTGYGTDGESNSANMFRNLRSRIIINSKYKPTDSKTCNVQFLNEKPTNDMYNSVVMGQFDNSFPLSPAITNADGNDEMYYEDRVRSNTSSAMKDKFGSTIARASNIGYSSPPDANRNYNNYKIDVIGRIPTPEEQEENFSWMVYVDEYLNGKNTRQFPSNSLAFTGLLIVCACVLGYSLCVIYGGNLDPTFRYSWFASVVLGFFEDVFIFEVTKTFCIKWYWLSSQQLPPII